MGGYGSESALCILHSADRTSQTPSLSKICARPVHLKMRKFTCSYDRASDRARRCQKTHPSGGGAKAHDTVFFVNIYRYHNVGIKKYYPHTAEPEMKQALVCILLSLHVRETLSFTLGRVSRSHFSAVLVNWGDTVVLLSTLESRM